VTAVKKWKPRVSREWLEREYVMSGRDCVQIGAELGKDPSTIRGWLVTYGIPTRPRGANGGARAYAFKRGQPSAFKGRKHAAGSIEKIRNSTIADGRVPYMVNGQPYMKGRTGDANPNWKGGATPERQEFYRSPGWKAAALAVWTRANACCERCGLDYRIARKTRLPKFHVHHIISFTVREVRTELTNLVLLCRRCHLWVHSRANTSREFLAVQDAAPSLSGLIDLGEAV